MLISADTDIKEALRFFTEKNVEVAFIVPTKNGLNKSIMDATASVRAYLRERGVHDYETQAQGDVNKVKIKAYFVKHNEIVKTTASLYRPKTKKGDPRIWFSKLKEYAAPFNLLAVITDGTALYLVNVSRKEILNSALQFGSPLSKVIYAAYKQTSQVAEELLTKLRAVAAKGFIYSHKKGDTAVGHLLETELCIPANSRKAPDYKGIELKSGRIRHTRKTLFAQVPNWALSVCKSSRDIAEKHGYDRNGQRRLYCTLSTKQPNSQQLFLEVDEARGLLKEKRHLDPQTTTDVAVWEFEVLKAALANKHRETFWISAKSEFHEGRERFRYETVTHTRSPNVAAFQTLCEIGVITVDHLIKIEGKTVTEKGPLFKINKEDFNLLFPPPMKHHLIEPG